MANASFSDSSDDFKRKHVKASENGLIAAAQVVVNAVKRGLRGGYTSGNFTHGIVLNSVTKGQVEESEDGWLIRIGSNVMYALFWELGHHNIFTRRYERVEIWAPAAAQNSAEAASAFGRVYVSTMAGA